MSDSAAGTPTSPPAAAGDAAALPSGYRIFEYEIDKPLGGGGFGITYLARDGNLNLPVAVKEYFPSDLATRGAQHAVQVRAGRDDGRAQYEWGLERFLDEARALATFRHPNIVRVLRYFRENGTAYIVMEYESGLALKRWVPQNAPLTQRSVLSLVHPLLDGLEQVHKAGFLHRDIKPDNIYVRADGQPVLLDFGSARRVSSNQDLTNIVSPGFAPFEQYHSQGHQGPWTDIYSIGAVLYWMVTGRKPTESASRVKSDGMAPASQLADAAVYGQSLLEAIDWALQPDESRRPQSVAEFRRAVGAVPGLEGAPSPASAPAGMAAAAYAPSVPAGTSGSTPSHKRNLLGTILFLDLVGYSIRSVDDQASVKRLFNELIGKALRGIPEDSRIAIDTGDGAAICFMGDPEEALHSAMLLRDLLTQRYGSQLAVRIGLHMGPVRIVSDINERVNVIGDGINVAQRVMDFAQPNQVLVSRAYYDVVSRIADGTADMFMYLGGHEDKHGRMHELYAAVAPQRSDTRKEAPSTGYTQTLPMQARQPIEDEAAQELEAELARHIGPLAKVLVAKARPIAASLQDLREALSHSIPDGKTRELFAQAGTSTSQPTSGHPVSRPERSLTQPRSSTSHPPSQSASGPSRSASVTTRPVDLPPEEQAAIEQTLSKYIGPMARMLVKREIARCGTFRELVAAVAANLDKKEQREDFLKALHKALPRRNF
jgi:serine/threonine protein kinase